MSKKLASKAALGAAVMSMQLFPIATGQEPFFQARLVAATTVSDTYTDGQSVQYTLDEKARTATVSGYSGQIGAAITIPATISYGEQEYPVVAIGSSAFFNSGLSSVVIGDNVTDIGTSAFQTTTAAPNFYKLALKSVTLGGKVQSIKTDAFAGNALSDIQFPDSLSKLGTRAFANNFLTHVTFGANVTDIASKAFQTNNISVITFAADCATSVGSAAFSGSPVEKMTLGLGVTWASDALNKISPLFDQLADMPPTGVRTIVESQGLVKKSWLGELASEEGKESESASADSSDHGSLPAPSTVDSVTPPSSSSSDDTTSGLLTNLSKRRDKTIRQPEKKLSSWKGSMTERRNDKRTVFERFTPLSPVSLTEEGAEKDVPVFSDYSRAHFEFPGIPSSNWTKNVSVKGLVSESGKTLKAAQPSGTNEKKEVLKKAKKNLLKGTKKVLFSSNKQARSRQKALATVPLKAASLPSLSLLTTLLLTGITIGYFLPRRINKQE